MQMTHNRLSHLDQEMIWRKPLPLIATGLCIADNSLWMHTDTLQLNSGTTEHPLIEMCLCVSYYFYNVKYI